MTADGKPAVAGAGGQPSQATAELKMLGKYQIEKKIGAGGMGAVYLARDTQLKRVVALKVLPKDKAENPTLVKRFKAEAQAAAQLRHDNIVAVYDSGEDQGYLFIAMEYVEGQDLFEMVQRRGVTPVKRSIEIIKQVAAALQHAYEQNIVHRDIKPSNLLIRRDGVVKLTDLGLARSVDDTLETNITRAGTTVGTVDYMSPEQARNSKAADIRSDIYSLGCTWYQMLTGEPPYPEGSVTNKLQAHAIKPIPDPRDINENIPEGVTAVLNRMMAKKAEDRYQTPAELIDDLTHSTLTKAAISREIFGDLSDYDQKTFPQGEADAEEESDDELVGGGELTPDEVPVRGGTKRRKPSKGPREADGDEAADAETRSVTGKSRDPKRHAKTADSDPAPRQKSRVQRADEDDDEVADSRPVSHKSRTTSRDEADDAVETTQRSKSKPTRVDEEQHDDRAKPSSNKPSSTKSRDAKSESKPAEAGASKAKSHKPLPPKRQPLPDEAEADKKGMSPETLKYLVAVAGLFVVIGGMGWLISAFSGGVAFEAPVVPPPGQNGLATTTGTPGGGTKKKSATDTGEEQVDPGTATNTTATSSNTNVTKPPFDVEAIPGWAGKESEPTGLITLTVGPAPKSPTHFNTLDEALRGAPNAGAVIKLSGTGPYPLSFVEIANVKRIVVMAATAQDKPVILLKPAEGQSTAGLKLTEGTLELRGLHFSVDRNQLASDVKVVEVVDGQLFARRCSFTATGPDTMSATAMTITSRQDFSAEPRMEPSVLVDQVMVRGDGLCGLSLDRANADVVLRESLLVTGSAAALELAGHLVAGVADVETHKPRRIVRVIRSTLCSRRCVFDVSAEVDGGGKPSRTEMVVQDSLCCAQGVAEGTSLVLAARWPQVRSTTDSWLTRLRWTSKGSLYLGFEQLVDLGSDFKVADATSWQRVWNAKHDAKQFQKLPFPDVSLSELSFIQPQDFDVRTLSYQEIKASGGGLPGAPVGALSVPDATSQQRAGALALRPRLPAAVLKPAEPTQVKKVDLKKEDLGQVLNKGDWPSGTLIEASGSGLCLSSPAKLEGKSVRIVFRQADGPPLKLQPKTGDGKVPDAAALFSITRGTLELTNAVLEGWPAPKPSTPPWLIQSTEATVVLNGCRLQGSDTDGPHQQGLIRWVAAAPAQALAEPPVLVCRDSFLTGFGCGLRIESGCGAVILRNSVLAIRGDAVDLQPVRSSGGLLMALDADHVTFSASKAAIRVQAAVGGDEPVASPLRMFVENCAFVSPLTFKAGEASESTLLQCAGPVFEQKQIEWWGVSNGVARQVVHLIRREGDPATASDKTGLPSWRETWDKSNDLRLLTGDKGVYLAGDLPNKWKDLRPGSFELHKVSQAATWAEGGKPIGANVRGVEDLSVAKKGGTETPGTAKTTTPSTTPAKTTAGKKNVGF